MSTSDERLSVGGLLSANASPQHVATHKTHSIFGLLSKRSIKVEPYPLQQQQQQQEQQQQEQRCVSAELRSESSCSAARADITFAKCQLPTAKLLAEQRIKCQTLPTISYSNVNSANGKPGISNSLLLLNQRGKSKSKAHVHRHSAVEAGSLSDGGEIVLRQSPAKQRSSNHNRFSHQFSLCCKAEKKPMTPPVTVRYNSIPDTVVNALRRDNLSLSWTLGSENLSLSLDSSDVNIQQPTQLPLTSVKAGVQQECASAPESPVTSKSIFNETALQTHISPTNLSQRSVEVAASTSNESGPIRPIAVSACRSRLRLKLFPPGTELPESLAAKADENATSSGMKRATTPQHMSSPNISTQRCVNATDTNCLSDYDILPFISHENIQMKRQSSGTGLARQTLLAAQMLSLIPAEEARERSFLEGRLGSSSLLGPSELIRVLPNSEITVFVGTWNMNGQSPPQQMNDFVLPATVEHVPDLVAIGTQESSPDRFEWEVTLQETLGPSHVLFHSTTLGTLHLAIYMRRDLIWYCSAPEDASMSVRTGSAFRTKGAVAISFCLFGTSMLFVTSHLTAHQQKVKERVSDVKRIIHALDLPKNLHMRYKNKDVTQNFDNVFWCGDLNFRLAEPREKLLDWIQNTKFPLPSHLPHGYMHTDQLSSVLAEGAAFRGFMEANITFPPTYKYDPGTQHFDTSSKQRAPAYTDRILYKYRQTQGLAMRRQSAAPGLNMPTQQYVQCLLYDSVPSITTSDHKPVWALFKTIIRAGTDSIPLAAGLFSRDIYLEGMKRRLNNQYSGSSAVCAIQ